MGRGSRTEHSSVAALRSAGAPAPATASVICHALSTLGPQLHSLVHQTNAKACEKAAGRGHRLIVAVNDMFNAEQLMHSPDPVQRSLAQTMIANSAWHLGRLAATFDKDGPLHQAVAGALERTVVADAPNLLQRLTAAELIDADEAAQLGPQIKEMARKAFLSNSANADYSSLLVLDRSQRVIEELQSLPDDDDPNLRLCREEALSDARKWQEKAHKYRGGQKKLEYQLNKEAASALTRAEAIASSLADPNVRRIHSALSTEVIEEHRQLVAEATGRPVAAKPLLAVNDRRWLAQMMNHHVNLGEAVQDNAVEALNSGGFGLMFAPDVAEQISACAAAGQLSETLLHEDVHQSQPQGAASVRGRLLSADHHLLELQILEGTTQAEAEDINRNASATLRTGPQTGAYAPWVGVMRSVFEAIDEDDPRSVQQQVSATPRNSRTAYIAERLLGSSERAQQQAVINTLLPLTSAAESMWGRAGAEQWVVEQTRKAISQLQDAHALAAA